MHCQKHLPSSSPNASFPKRRYRFDTLNWIAAVFVIATPIFIAYRLFWH